VTDWQQKQFKWWLAQLQWALVCGWNITESETLFNIAVSVGPPSYKCPECLDDVFEVYF